MVLTLVPVTSDNYGAVLRLSVARSQSELVAPVVKSLADAYVYAGARALAAVEDQTVVGFVLLFPFEKGGMRVMNLVRILVDKDHQGRGLGRATLEAAIELAKASEPRPSRMKLSVMPRNVHAIRLYERAGFEGHEIEDGERVMWLDLTR